MKTVSVNYYVAPDGKRFTSQKQAEKYEDLYKKVMKIYKTIPKRPDNIEFMNGEGYVQHKKRTKQMLEQHLVDLTNEYFDLKGKDRYTRMCYGIGRYANDSNTDILNDLVTRWQCINEKTEREYGQPYYANNPSEATGKQLNK